MIEILLYVLAAALALFGWLLAKRAQSKRQTFWGRLLVILGLWLLAVRLLGLLPGSGESEAFAAERMQLFGFTISSTVVITWIAMAIILLFAVLIRIFVIPKMRDVPGSIQAVLEAAVRGKGDRPGLIAGKAVGGDIRTYLFSAAILILAYALLGLLGIQPFGVDAAMALTLVVCALLFWNAKILLILGAWLLSIQLIGLLPGGAEGGGFKVEIAAERMQVFGFSISSTVIITWIAMAIVLFIAILIRIFVIPKMRDVPRGTQVFLEAAVDGIGDYSNSIVGKKIGRSISPYLFSVAALMVACAAVELLGLRAPTADLTMTFALALCTFLAFNYYGIREKGLRGRIHSLASPTALVLPIRIVCDIAVPVSMACRLFGNMLGGMVVMDLLYSALGKAAVGIPSVIGLYFNAFHPLIQTFIFVTLTLSFIAEAAGEEE